MHIRNKKYDFMFYQLCVSNPFWVRKYAFLPYFLWTSKAKEKHFPLLVCFISKEQTLSTIRVTCLWYVGDICKIINSIISCIVDIAWNSCVIFTTKILAPRHRRRRMTFSNVFLSVLIRSSRLQIFCLRGWCSLAKCAYICELTSVM